MKARYYLTLLLAASMFTACQTEEIPVPEKEGNTEVEEPEKEEEEEEENGESEPEVTNPLKMSASLKSMQESRANLITQWQAGHNMGLYTDGNNLSYTYDGNEWIAKTPFQVDKDLEVFAYYPYTEQEISNNQFQVDIAAQNDVLWGKTTVSADFPTAQLEMEHTLALVRVKILRDEYMGTGRVESVSFNNVPEHATFFLNDGNVAIFSNEPRTTIKAGGAFMLDDANPAVSELIIPHSGAGDYSVTFNVDGKDLTYQFPDYHIWESGMMYTYTIKIKGQYNCEINVDDVPIDVEYWEQFGKTDEIVWKYPDNNGMPGWTDFEDTFTISTNFTKYGYDTYQNEGKVFGLFYYHFGTPGTFEGKLRFVFMQGDKIVEKFQPVDFSMSGNWGGKAVQCYVTSSPSTYQLVPLFQRKGESTWFKAADYDNGGPEEWMYEVLPPASEDLPSLRNLYLEEDGVNVEGLAYRIPYNKDFGVVFTLSNKGENALKGKIKATWEREFKLKSNSYRPGTKVSGAVNDNEWNDEIGTMDISIPAGVRFWKGLINCKVTKWYDMPMSNNVQYAGPVIHLYWQPEGSSEWTLMRLDADYLFNTGYEGPDYSIWNETRNCIGVSLKEWYE